jgi:23S rRNA pseudouridine2605 synthase
MWNRPGGKTSRSADTSPVEPGQRVHLDRALSKLGLCSRGTASKAIQAGEITVNGAVIRDERHWVDWKRDAIRWVTQSEPPSDPVQAKRYGVLHKPKGYVTTHRDELQRDRIVYALLPPEAQGGWLFAVGRLDKDSEGLLLFTNDGPWSESLLGPDSHCEKRYRVRLNRKLQEEDRRRFESGVELDGSPTLACQVATQTGNWVEVTLHEGRNRQIRRMFHALGYKVDRLIRVGIGKLSLEDGFAPGEFRWLTEAEVGGLGGLASKGS